MYINAMFSKLCFAVICVCSVLVFCYSSILYGGEARRPRVQIITGVRAEGDPARGRFEGHLRQLLHAGMELADAHRKQPIGKAEK